MTYDQWKCDYPYYASPDEEEGYYEWGWEFDLMAMLEAHVE